ncbi:MAG: exodeoxyribonuclease VII large subunit [Bacteroidetes bacterium RIFOXYA12_FULL_35_11]|nr:MAG: exodeoxyribonuclease VII large subunit [Bacteroidetes bacterium GWF2_35_48]OFY78912.1 MAG: exodeoxyribonuclease VII large subunit [Bacteroidetes bacterium RIFOXYA12_FULL_35_11]OFY93613.1 MAG: exodeoxyribonuclease VII large subunit [Bacteroidetes bacterium RIFOXYC12_FULL_35_7]HBX49669.1 exodeoxyribonuclease VII large subunit [Bacteroidales bacterium]
MMKEKTPISLYELNLLIKGKISQAFPEKVWIVAEISDLTLNRNGHCYLDLIQKDTISNQTIARSRATIWSYTFRSLRPFFESSTGREISAGLKIMVLCSVEFHEVYGFSLNILDIDPTYTLGDIEKKKKEIIAKLQAEGIFNMNKELEFPAVPQKIAIISSPTAAGYEDFIKQLHNNPSAYKFYTKLFPATMQGDETETSIIAALEKIYAYEYFFDVVVIIRGGGAKADLNSFDTYNLAYHITQFPLPVITGIGHERDDTITDMVAHTKCKTPTAVAEFLINEVTEFEMQLEELKNLFTETITEQIKDHKQKIESLSYSFLPLVQNLIFQKKNKQDILQLRFISNVQNVIENSKAKLTGISASLYQNIAFYKTINNQKIETYRKMCFRSCENYINSGKHKIEMLEIKNKSHDPYVILKKGYSITRKNGKILKSIADINEGDTLENILANGKIISTVKTKTPANDSTN